MAPELLRGQGRDMNVILDLMLCLYGIRATIIGNSSCVIMAETLAPAYSVSRPMTRSRSCYLTSPHLALVGIVLRQEVSSVTARAEEGPGGEWYYYTDIYPAFSSVELLQYCALIGRELQSVEI